MNAQELLRQIGTIQLPQSSRCALCHQPGVELAVEDNGEVSTYHWRCVDRQARKLGLSGYSQFRLKLDL